MPELTLAMCGLDCSACRFRTEGRCQGCHQHQGKVFWGTCAVATCCLEKGHGHCGMCGQCPCETLKGFSYATDHGDNGERIRRVQAAARA